MVLPASFRLKHKIKYPTRVVKLRSGIALNLYKQCVKEFSNEVEKLFTCLWVYDIINTTQKIAGVLFSEVFL